MEMQVTTFNYPTEVFAICASQATLYTFLHIISIWLHIPNHLRRELQMEPKLLSVSEVIVHPHHPLTRLLLGIHFSRRYSPLIKHYSDHSSIIRVHPRRLTIGNSKHLLRRYLDPQNMPKTPSQEVFGCLGKMMLWIQMIFERFISGARFLNLVNQPFIEPGRCNIEPIQCIQPDSYIGGHFLSCAAEGNGRRWIWDLFLCFSSSMICYPPFIVGENNVCSILIVGYYRNLPTNPVVLFNKQPKMQWYTFPKTNMFTLKIDGWKMKDGLF